MSGFFRRTVWAGGALALLVAVLFVQGKVLAAGAISQSYSTSGSLSKGTLVSLTTGKSPAVEATNSTRNLSRLAGVVADAPLIELSGGDAGSVKVVTEGPTETLVSNINGPVKAGDKITASPVSGIGMKAVIAGEIVGTAQSDLTAVATVDQSVDGLEGKQESIKVGLLPVSVGISYYSPPGMGRDFLASLVPSLVQSFANNVAGHEVSAMRVLLSGMVLIVAFVIVGLMLNVSIRNGMISIGRNPMAQKMVRKGLNDVLIAAIAVLVITAGIVYATLKF